MTPKPLSKITEKNIRPRRIKIFEIVRLLGKIFIQISLRFLRMSDVIVSFSKEFSTFIWPLLVIDCIPETTARNSFVIWSFRRSNTILAKATSCRFNFFLLSHLFPQISNLFDMYNIIVVSTTQTLLFGQVLGTVFQKRKQFRHPQSRYTSQGHHNLQDANKLCH